MSNEKMYNNTPSSAVTTPPATDNTAPATQGPRPGRAADRIYDNVGKEESVYGTELKPGLERLAVAELHDRAKTDSLRKEAATFFHDLGILPSEVPRIHSRIVDAALNPPDAATRATWQKETMTGLRSKYGNEAAARLKAANEYISQKNLSKYIYTAAGDHPDVALAIVEKAWRWQQDKKFKELKEREAEAAKKV